MDSRTKKIHDLEAANDRLRAQCLAMANGINCGQLLLAWRFGVLEPIKLRRENQRKIALAEKTAREVVGLPRRQNKWFEVK
jgi:hypothetical protein